VSLPNLASFRRNPNRLVATVLLGVVVTTQVEHVARVLGDEPNAAGEDGGPAKLLGLDSATLDEPLITDRPDFTESTDAVPRGHLQLEAGYTFTYDREKLDRTRDHTSPEILLRIGLVDRLELRLGWAGYSWTETRFETESEDGDRIIREEWSQGANDAIIGF